MFQKLTNTSQWSVIIKLKDLEGQIETSKSQMLHKLLLQVHIISGEQKSEEEMSTAVFSN